MGIVLGLTYGTRSSDMKNGVIRYFHGTYFGFSEIRHFGYTDAVWFYRELVQS